MVKIPTEAEIEESVIEYIKTPLLNRGVPNREDAIRHVTGEMPAMPSAVGKVIKALMDSGRVVLGANGKLILKS